MDIFENISKDLLELDLLIREIEEILTDISGVVNCEYNFDNFDKQLRVLELSNKIKVKISYLSLFFDGISPMREKFETMRNFFINKFLKKDGDNNGE